MIKDIKNKVIELATKYPDAIYLKKGYLCHYLSGKVENGPEREGCLIGQGMVECGINIEESNDYAKEKILKTIETLEETVDNVKDLDFLSLIQMYQDSGNTWGRSLLLAMEDNYEDD